MFEEIECPKCNGKAFVYTFHWSQWVFCCCYECGFCNSIEKKPERAVNDYAKRFKGVVK